jgi:hypothetical protein
LATFIVGNGLLLRVWHQATQIFVTSDVQADMKSAECVHEQLKKVPHLPVLEDGFLFFLSRKSNAEMFCK